MVLKDQNLDGVIDRIWTTNTNGSRTVKKLRVFDLRVIDSFFAANDDFSNGVGIG